METACFTGLYELDDRAGVICLSAERIAAMCRIRIQDNGIGMDKGKLTEILAKKDKPVVNTRRGGYGIGNILERRIIYYDDDFMFEIDSAILVGTTVTIPRPLFPQRFPADPRGAAPSAAQSKIDALYRFLLKYYALHIHLLFFSFVFAIFKAAQRLSA